MQLYASSGSLCDNIRMFLIVCLRVCARVFKCAFKWVDKERSNEIIKGTKKIRNKTKPNKQIANENKVQVLT